jgi:hypothetical protein
MCIFFKFFTVTQIYYTCYSNVVLLVGALNYVYVHYLFATSAGNLKMVSVSLTDTLQVDESKRLVRVCSVKASVVGGVGRNGENESKRPLPMCKGGCRGRNGVF